MTEVYTKLFELIDDTLTKQQQQKADGINDYNLLTTVLKYHDEVRLNSRMIGSLLDPEGKHYQDNLFLDKFLDILGLVNFFSNTKNVKVYVEYKDIDLYLTDGERHIIIENKVWAIDQPCQVMKYINLIKKEYNLKEDENGVLEDLKVFYLTPRNKNCPSKHKLEKYTDGLFISYPDKDSLDDCSRKMNKKNTIDFDLEQLKSNYKKISYKEEIFAWLEECQNAVNVPNLIDAIRQYIEVVERINKTYKGKIMTIEKVLTKVKVLTEEDKNNLFVNEDYLKSALVLDNSMDEIKGLLLLKFFQNINIYFQGKGKDFDILNNNLNLKGRSFMTYENKCDKWFDSKLKNNQRQIDIGTFAKFSEKIAIFVLVGKYHLHIGITDITNDNDEHITIGSATDDLPIIPKFEKREKWDLKSSTIRFDDFYEIMNYQNEYFDFDQGEVKKELDQLIKELEKLM